MRRNRLEGESLAQLRGYILKIEDVEDRIHGLREYQKIIYGEARACGFPTNVVKEIVKNRKAYRNRPKETDDLLELYESALSSVEKI